MGTLILECSRKKITVDGHLFENLFLTCEFIAKEIESDFRGGIYESK